MKLVMNRDGITYELGTTCTFQIYISGRLPSEMNSEADGSDIEGLHIPRNKEKSP